MGKLVHVKMLLTENDPLGDIKPDDTIYTLARKKLEEVHPGVVVEPSGYFAYVAPEDAHFDLKAGDALAHHTLEYALMGVVYE